MFGWRRQRRSQDDEVAPVDTDEVPDEDVESFGPYDASESENAREIERLDLGSVRFPVPDGSQLQVEVDPSGPVRAVHLITEVGRLTVGAYAAPKSSRLWPEVSRELSEQLHKDGARVFREEGEWGPELVADSSNTVLRFAGVDGPRWMLRGVAASPAEQSEACTKLLYSLLDETIVVRGEDPLPVRTPLPIVLPDAIAKHIQQQEQEKE